MAGVSDPLPPRARARPRRRHASDDTSRPTRSCGRVTRKRRGVTDGVFRRRRPAGRALERCRARRTLLSKRWPTSQADGQSGDEPAGTLATGAPASVQGELNGISARRYGTVSPRARLLVADQRRQHGISGERAGRSERGRVAAREIELLRAETCHVGVDGSNSREQPRAHVRPVLGEPRAQPAR